MAVYLVFIIKTLAFHMNMFDYKILSIYFAYNHVQDKNPD